MAKKPRLTGEQLADEFTAMAFKHLNKLSPDERERRIQAFEKRIASGAKRTAVRSRFDRTQRS